MGMVAPTGFTAEAVRAFPNDGNRYEVVEGELLVTPAPGWLHQRAVGKMYSILDRSLDSTAAYEPVLSPADVELDDRTLVQPDIFITRRRTTDHIPGWNDVELVLVIEVLSPSTAHYDRLIKRSLYQRQGIEYWIVDIDAHVVERWMPGDERPEVLADSIEWRIEGLADGCVIDLQEYFRAVTKRP